METCKCFSSRPKWVYATGKYGEKLLAMDISVPICNGTRERDECSCGISVTFTPRREKEEC